MSHKILILLFIVTLAPAALAKKLPLWELGVATVFVYSADYPASDEMSPRQIILPTLAYRGEHLRQDKRGTRARFFKSDRWVLDLGTGVSLPTNSDENEARQGMEDLAFVLEMGPRLIYTLFEEDAQSLLLQLPYRFAIATDLSFTREIGTRINPEIEYTRLVTNKVRLRFGLEMNYASEVYNDYIYEVENKYATPKREAYNGKGGYLGSSVTAAAIYRGRKFTSFIGLSYNRYDRSANENSPLYKIKEGSGIAIGMNYFFYSSDLKGEKAAGVE